MNDVNNMYTVHRFMIGEINVIISNNRGVPVRRVNLLGKSMTHEEEHKSCHLICFQAGFNLVSNNTFQPVL